MSDIRNMLNDIDRAHRRFRLIWRLVVAVWFAAVIGLGWVLVHFLRKWW